jgi:TIR domain
LRKLSNSRQAAGAAIGSIMTTTEYRVFFSHGGADSFIVKDYFKPKIESSGASVFFAKGERIFGNDFRTQILEELRKCDEIVVYFTPSSILRQWVFVELGAALVRQIRVVVISYGVSSETLQTEGILSILGTNIFVDMKESEIEDYAKQLKDRVVSKAAIPSL